MKYRALGDRVIARRRPPENESEIIITSDATWLRNKWCDVLAVGEGMWCSGVKNEDGTKGAFRPVGIDVGDVAYIVQFHGTKIDPMRDPRLISIHCHQLEDAGDTVWAKQQVRRFVRTADGKVFRGDQIQQRMDIKVNLSLLPGEVEGSLYKELPACKGDYLLTDKYGQQVIYTPEAFEWQFEEIEDSGRFGVQLRGE